MSDKKPSPEMVGRQFIKKYYERLDSQPDTMHRFYQDKSSMIYGEDSNSKEMVTGVDAIRSKMAERVSRKWVLNLEDGSVDAQQSMDGGVLLLVTGSITNQMHPQPRQFVQSFFLAEHIAKNNAASYYVLNDTFRIVDMTETSRPITQGATVSAIFKDNPSEDSNQSKPQSTSSATGKDSKPIPPPLAATLQPPQPAAATTVSKERGNNQLPQEASKEGGQAKAASHDKESSKGVSPVTEQPKEKKPFSWATMVQGSASNPATTTPSSQEASVPIEKSVMGSNASSGAVSATKPLSTQPSSKTSRRSQTKASSSSSGETNTASAPSTLRKQDTPEAETERNARKVNPTTITPQEVPSTAIYVKGLETPISEDALKDTFLPFMTEPDRDKLLIAEHHDRGFAFIDLNSQEAVARAVSASLTEQGIKMKLSSGDGQVWGDKLVVEPSKKPVRPSGVKAIQERKNSGSLSPKLTNSKGKARDRNRAGKERSAANR